jgi:hypothetical protein
LPVWGLCVKELSLLARGWRYSPATESTGFASTSFGHDLTFARQLAKKYFQRFLKCKPRGRVQASAPALTRTIRSLIKWPTLKRAYQRCRIADDDRSPLVEKWRAAIAKQLLTPAPDAASIKWKQMAMARDRYIGVKPERVERALADDLVFLAAHPVRQSNRRRQS